MKGEIIKEFLRRNKIPQTRIADALGISQQTLSAALGTDDIKTGLLERIAAELGIPVVEFFGETVAATGPNSTAINGSGNNVATGQQLFLEEIAAQRRVTESVLEQNGKLLEIINTLSKK
ncbi:MAG: helix-turn-helix transcriptional regulator [Bacteroidales bacterium]|nr:helix-turn-helix transcriptional regulator [Bacteroidales bacterium]